MFSFRYQKRDAPHDFKKFTEDLAKRLDGLLTGEWRRMLRVHSLQKYNYSTASFPKVNCAEPDSKEDTWNTHFFVEVAGTQSQVNDAKVKITAAMEEGKLKIDDVAAVVVQ